MHADAMTVLIIGGYGIFGGRVADLLANESRLTLLIAGRTLHKAKSFVGRHEDRAVMIPLEFDRDADVTQKIAGLSPNFVIDASGPFQVYGTDPYRIVKAAIASGAHYLDIADSSAFVHGIEDFNSSAQVSDVFVLSGASTCIALSSAVFRRLTRDLSRVKSLSGGIAPSPHAGVGFSVVQAVATMAGKPVQAIRNGHVDTVFPFTDARNFIIAPPGYRPLRPRTYSLVDVPDLTLAKKIVPKVENIWFGAAPIPGVYHFFLRILARAIKRGWLASLHPMSPLMYKVLHHLSWGEHRGGMFIEACGQTRSGQTVTRSWHLIAEGDDGPTIPAMASAAIIKKCLNGHWPPSGARPAVAELELDDFKLFFDQRDIHIGERIEIDNANRGVFRTILGNAWSNLPEEIRQVHVADGTHRFAGRANVLRGQSLLSRLVGRIVGFPPAASDIPVDVTMICADDRELWHRDFDGHTFSSVMAVGAGKYSHLLCEKFGPISFAMALVLDKSRLHYMPQGWTLFGLAMPHFLAPKGKMYEYVEDGRFNFYVEVRLPIIGHLVTYEGSLAPAPAESKH